MDKGSVFACRQAGVLFVSAFLIQGCSSSATISPNKPGRIGANSCNPPLTQLSAGVTASIVSRYSSTASHLSQLSAREADQLFVDRDVKGREISYRNADVDRDAPKNPSWVQKDLEKDGIPGTATERARAELNLKSDGEPVVVAVIDTGMDIDHEALKANIWAGGAGDANYPGAVQGWNFLGGKDGNVYHTTLEVTRELRRMRALKQASAALTPLQQKYLDELEKDYAEGKASLAKILELRKKSRDEFSANFEILKSNCTIQPGTLEELRTQLRQLQSDNKAISDARTIVLGYLEKDWDLARFDDTIKKIETKSIPIAEQYYYNLEFDSSTIVGDDPTKMDDLYGTADVKPTEDDEAHSTHVAGIIGAVPGVKAGIQGQASNVRLMALRAVPDGDERDKDVGNAIRYAADHGARVINMSFGKHYSPNRDYVWNAIRYAGEKGVLLVHAAGNDALDNDTESHYPDREIRDEERNLISTLSNVIEVGASTRFKSEKLTASFSDYGARTVDLFAPGFQVYSTTPSNHYAEFNGTSMATPEVAGVAALVLSQYPNLTVDQLKKVILDAVNPFKGLQVLKPGSTTLVDFGTLSVTGGTLDAYKALKSLEQQALAGSL